MKCFSTNTINHKKFRTFWLIIFIFENKIVILFITNSILVPGEGILSSRHKKVLIKRNRGTAIHLKVKMSIIFILFLISFIYIFLLFMFHNFWLFFLPYFNNYFYTLLFSSFVAFKFPYSFRFLHFQLYILFHFLLKKQTFPYFSYLIYCVNPERK